MGPRKCRLETSNISPPEPLRGLLPLVILGAGIASVLIRALRRWGCRPIPPNRRLIESWVRLVELQGRAAGPARFMDEQVCRQRPRSHA